MNRKEEFILVIDDEDEEDGNNMNNMNNINKKEIKEKENGYKEDENEGLFENVFSEIKQDIGHLGDIGFDDIKNENNKDKKEEDNNGFVIVGESDKEKNKEIDNWEIL